MSYFRKRLAWRKTEERFPDIPKYQPQDTDHGTIFTLQEKINKELRPSIQAGCGLNVLLSVKRAEGENSPPPINVNQRYVIDLLVYLVLTVLNIRVSQRDIRIEC